MKATLAELLAEAVEEFTPIFASATIDGAAVSKFMETYPSQIVVLATQAVWTRVVDQALVEGGKGLKSLFDREVQLLKLLADTVLGDLEILTRKTCEQLITECVHQRDVIEKLIKHNATNNTHYLWLLQMRYVYTPEGDFLQRLQIKMANANLNYGFEYLGVPERLVRTPLTDRCFLTLTQALCQRLGGPGAATEDELGSRLSVPCQDPGLQRSIDISVKPLHCLYLPSLVGLYASGLRRGLCGESVWRLGPPVVRGPQGGQAD